MIVEFQGEKLRVSIEFYQDNGNKAIILLDDDGSPYCVATVNVDGLEDNEVAIKDYSENEGILEELINAGAISKPKRLVTSGFVTIPICDLLI